MEEAAERLRQFLLTSANSLGIKDDWIIPCADLLEKVAKERDGLHKYIKFKCVATSDSPRSSETYLLLDQYPVNVVMVEGSISEEYKGYFLSRKITAVQNMKRRLQRYPSLGYSCTALRCEKTIESLNDPINEKPLMFLGDCGSLTILLKGSSTAELKLMKRMLKTGYNQFRNELLSSDYFLVALPPSKIIPWEMDGGQDEVVTIREEEVSSYIAYSLQQVHDESSESRPKSSVFCQHRDSFHELRSKCNMTESQYISSLSRCDTWEAKGGKSGALFAKSRDTRLIIKEINQAEFESFAKFGPMYFEYMKEANKTFLTKIYGVYKVTLGQAKFLMVMENLNFDRRIAMQYDLKGLVHGRLAPDSAQVRLDQNFLNDMKRLRLHLNPYLKQDLQTVIRNDTAFLSGINVMDYSLLVGVDMENHELVCGIIDYLAPYSLKKKLETVGKSLLLLGKETRPTVIRPSEYKKRFVDFMVKQFLGEIDLRTKVKELEQQLRKERDARLDAEKRLEELNKKKPIRSRSF
ncbi:unnamed protein product [Brassica rapa]|uniref:PIPK domain-containing protein n=3 Tax=Brassica TaxID=3705 RepID=A0A8D9I2R4_BRACM|nr:unnamed protein product [Brassica napus]CAG7909272.1 unnamed protein product [Brassica rapa]